MRSVLFFTITLYFFAQLPVLYGLFAVHGRDGIGEMWGIAPNQFWFLVFVFPLASFSTCVALRLLVTAVVPALPQQNPVRWFFQNWLVAVLLAVILACVLAWSDYFGSVKSFDKLKPELAKRAVISLDFVRSHTDSLDGARSASELSLLFKDVTDQTVLSQRLRTLSPVEYLRVVQNPRLQLQLRLLDPTIQALYLLQEVVVLGVALLTIFCSMATIATLKTMKGVAPDALSTVYRAVFSSVLLFSTFVICYRQYRSELERYVGRTDTILPDVFAAGAVICLLTVLAGLNEKGSFEWAQILSARLIPLLVLTSGFVAEVRRPEVLRRLIGIETTASIQAVWAVVFILGAIFLSVSIWPHSEAVRQP
jgi:hypothetical protein